MWTAQDYALVISTLTGLLALGVPPIVGALDARRLHRAASRAEIERLLFYVLDNYRRQRHEMDKFLWEIIPVKVNEFKNETVDDRSVQGFRQAIPRLKALAALHRIDDSGFFEAVAAYLDTTSPPPSDPNSDDDARNKTIAELLVVLDERRNLDARIEASTINFLTNIEARLN